MFQFIAENTSLATISPSFSTRDEAVQFGRDHWTAIKRTGTRVCRLRSDEGVSTLWVDPRELPPGHYGVDGKRYVIERPSDGAWKGWTFLKTGSVYHDSKSIAMVRPDGEIVRDHPVLKSICNDPTEAIAEYGRITGRCCICSRVLEDPESRRRGIGPVCAERFGV